MNVTDLTSEKQKNLGTIADMKSRLNVKINELLELKGQVRGLSRDKSNLTLKEQRDCQRYQQSIEDKDCQLRSKINEILDLENQVQDLNAKVANLTSEKQDDCQRYRQSIADKDVQVNAKINEVIGLKKIIDGLEKNLGGLRLEIEADCQRYSGSITDCNRELDAKRSEVDAFKGTIEGLEADVANLTREKQQNEASIRQRDEIINSQGSSITTLSHELTSQKEMGKGALAKVAELNLEVQRYDSESREQGNKIQSQSAELKEKDQQLIEHENTLKTVLTIIAELELKRQTLAEGSTSQAKIIEKLSREKGDEASCRESAQNQLKSAKLKAGLLGRDLHSKSTAIRILLYAIQNYPGETRRLQCIVDGEPVLIWVTFMKGSTVAAFFLTTPKLKMWLSTVAHIERHFTDEEMVYQVKLLLVSSVLILVPNEFENGDLEWLDKKITEGAKALKLGTQQYPLPQLEDLEEECSLGEGGLVGGGVD